jgi:hypothetical protein
MANYRHLVLAKQVSLLSAPAGLIQHAGDGLGMFCDDGEQDAGGSFGARAALLPVAEGCGRQAELDRELRLTDAHASPELADVDVGNADDIAVRIELTE